MESSKARLGADLAEGESRISQERNFRHGARLAAATNDIGLISLPNGRYLSIAVFITDSTVDDAAREKVIARIARAAFDAAASMG